MPKYFAFSVATVEPISAWGVMHHASLIKLVAQHCWDISLWFSFVVLCMINTLSTKYLSQHLHSVWTPFHSMYENSTLCTNWFIHQANTAGAFILHQGNAAGAFIVHQGNVVEHFRSYIKAERSSPTNTTGAFIVHQGNAAGAFIIHQGNVVEHFGSYIKAERSSPTDTTGAFILHQRNAAGAFIIHQGNVVEHFGSYIKAERSSPTVIWFHTVQMPTANFK